MFNIDTYKLDSERGDFSTKCLTSGHKRVIIFTAINRSLAAALNNTETTIRAQFQTINNINDKREPWALDVLIQFPLVITRRYIKSDGDTRYGATFGFRDDLQCKKRERTVIIPAPHARMDMDLQWHVGVYRYYVLIMYYEE